MAPIGAAALALFLVAETGSQIPDPPTETRCSVSATVSHSDVERMICGYRSAVLEWRSIAQTERAWREELEENEASDSAAALRSAPPAPDTSRAPWWLSVALLASLASGVVLGAVVAGL